MIERSQWKLSSKSLIEEGGFQATWQLHSLVFCFSLKYNVLISCFILVFNNPNISQFNMYASNISLVNYLNTY